MSAFTPSEIAQNETIFDLFQSRGIVLFKSRDLLSETIYMLKNDGYRVCNVDCGRRNGIQEIYHQILTGLNIDSPDDPHFGFFYDEISNIPFKGAKGKGIILVLMNFATIYKSHKKDASNVLHILADQHYFKLHEGNRFLTLVQSDDPRINKKIGLIGGFTPHWNRAEFFDKSREI